MINFKLYLTGKGYTSIEWIGNSRPGLTIGTGFDECVLIAAFVSASVPGQPPSASAGIFHCPAGWRNAHMHNSSRLKVRFLFVVLAQILSVEQVRCFYCNARKDNTCALRGPVTSHRSLTAARLRLPTTTSTLDACMEEPESALADTLRAIFHSN